MSENRGNTVRSAKFRVSAEHPSLPGHFPGNPIVPAVVLLNQLVECARQEFGDKIQLTGIEQAKFLAPLSPNEEVTATLAMEGARLRFKVSRADTPIAQGSFLVAGEAFAMR